MEKDTLIRVEQVRELIGLSQCLGQFLTNIEFNQITKVFDELALRMIAECEDGE